METKRLNVKCIRFVIANLNLSTVTNFLKEVFLRLKD